MQVLFPKDCWSIRRWNLSNAEQEKGGAHAGGYSGTVDNLVKDSSKPIGTNGAATF